MNPANDRIPVAPPPRRTWFGWAARWGCLLLFLLLGTITGLSFYFRIKGGGKLDRAIAEADRLDPAWRWDELEAQRPTIPEADNAAHCVAAVAAQTNNVDVRKKIPWDEIDNLPATTALTPQQTAALGAAVGELEKALHEAERLDRLSRGRYPAVPPASILTLAQPYWDDTRKVTNALRIQVLFLAQERRCDDALRACQRILRTASSLGDDPVLLALLTRFAVRSVAVEMIERTLAQGEAKPLALQQTAEVLRQELEFPALLCALRGERAFQHLQMQHMEAGDVVAMSGGTVKSNGLAGLGLQLARGWLQENHALLLTLMTEAVEIAKLPPEQRWARFQQLDKTISALIGQRQVFAATALPTLTRVASSATRTDAELRCALVALAVESYRLAHGHWPASLDDLVPGYLPRVPLDPVDGKPLRYRQLPDGIVVYSVGGDGADNGGAVDRKGVNFLSRGYDLGFRLWNPDRRHQAPTPTNPPPPGGPGSSTSARYGPPPLP